MGLGMTLNANQVDETPANKKAIAVLLMEIAVAAYCDAKLDFNELPAILSKAIEEHRIGHELSDSLKNHPFSSAGGMG